MICSLLCPWNSPGKNTRVGCHSLLQGIFPTQVSNPGLLHCRWILYRLSHQGTPITSKEALRNGKWKLSGKWPNSLPFRWGTLQSTYYPSLPGAHSGRGLDITLQATFPHLPHSPAPPPTGASQDHTKHLPTNPHLRVSFCGNPAKDDGESG